MLIAHGQVLAVIPGVEPLAPVGLGPLVGGAVEGVGAALFQVPDDLFKPLGLVVDALAPVLADVGGILPVAAAAAPAGAADLEPEHGPEGAALAALQGKPQVILVGAAAEQPPGVPVDAGDVGLELLVREGGLHLFQRLEGQGAEGLVQRVLEFLLVLQEPGAVVVHGEAPDEIAGGLGKSVKHSSPLSGSGKPRVFRVGGQASEASCAVRRQSYANNPSGYPDGLSNDSGSAITSRLLP